MQHKHELLRRDKHLFLYNCLLRRWLLWSDPLLILLLWASVLRLLFTKIILVSVLGARIICQHLLFLFFYRARTRTLLKTVDLSPPDLTGR